MEINSYHFLKKKRRNEFELDYNSSNYNSNYNNTNNSNKEINLNKDNKENKSYYELLNKLANESNLKEKIVNISETEIIKFNPEIFLNYIENKSIDLAKLSHKEHLDIYYKERLNLIFNYLGLQTY